MPRAVMYTDADGLLKIDNSTVVNNAPAAIYGSPPSGNEVDSGSDIRNSIIYSNGTPTLADQVAGCYRIRYSCVQGASNGGSVPTCNQIQNTFSNVPLLDQDRRLTDSSPCIDTGSLTVYSSTEINDVYDVDQDLDLGEKTPDRDLNIRIWRINVAPCGAIDRGSHEYGSDNCVADINNSGHVNVDDLLIVINNWGECDDPVLPCYADIAPTTCSNGVVNVDDLNYVINNWGVCPMQGCNLAQVTPPDFVMNCLMLCGSDNPDCLTDCLDGNAQDD